MLTEIQAQYIMTKSFPEFSLKSWAIYKDVYLFRVQYPIPEEKDFDPFFSVNKTTGEVRDFSVLVDGDINEIAALKWNDI